MGTRPARITASDFLTPPELRALPLAGNAAGRIGGVRLELIAGPAGTRVGKCYQQVPLRVLPAFRFGGAGPALLYLVNPTAGLLDGDAHLVELVARPGTRALVVGQSATRVHPGWRGFSTQQWTLRVEAGAVLAVLPGPTIPFQACRYYQRVHVDLDPGAGFIWGDIWLAGRYARGRASESFRFQTLIQDLVVYRDARLVFRDRFCWQGPWDAETARWHFGGSPACGSLFVSGAAKGDEAPSEADRDLDPGLDQSSRRILEEAVFRTAAGDTCMRWRGPSEAVISGVVRAALRVAAVAGGPADEPWLPAGDLAPVHWFSAGIPR